MNIKKILLSLPVKLCTIIICCFIFGESMPQNTKSIFFAISLAIKSGLIFILPLIIFSFSFYSFSQSKNGIFLFTVILFSLICFSNFLAVMTTYSFARILESFIAISNDVEKQQTAIHLAPSFTLEFPTLIHNFVALMIGAACGVYASHKNSERLKNLAKNCAASANKFLQNIFIPVLPLFIFGFALKLQHEGTLLMLFNNFLSLLLMMLIIYVLYISIAYYIINNCDINKTAQTVLNIIPAAIVGFSTMSSAATMPVLIACATKNTKNPELTQTIIPSVINTHMLGDALGIPLMAIFLYLREYHHLPPLELYLPFAFSYVLAKFAAAGVPGGTIIVMIPVFESYLNFTPEMSALAFIVAILFDPFYTMANIFGNGLFPLVFERIWKKARFSS